MNLRSTCYGIFLMMASTLCHAGLMGSNVTANYYFPDFSSRIGMGTATVTAGYEWVNPTGFPGDFEAFDFIDIGDDFILFDFQYDACCQWSDGLYNGFELIFDPGVLADLTAVSFAPNSDGYVDSMFSVVADTLFIDWRGGAISGVETVQVQLSFAGSPVPVPGTVLLFGASLAGLVLARRRVGDRG